MDTHHAHNSHTPKSELDFTHFTPIFDNTYAKEGPEFGEMQEST